MCIYIYINWWCCCHLAFLYLTLDQVHFLNGDSVNLNVLASTLGRDLREMISDKLPSKAGAFVSLAHEDLGLIILQKTLQQQGLVGDITLCCVYTPTCIYGCWSLIHGYSISSDLESFEGVTELRGMRSCSHLQQFPKSLLSLTLVMDLTSHWVPVWVFLIFNVWLLVGASTKVLKEWIGPVALKIWHLDMSLVRAWEE